MRNRILFLVATAILVSLQLHAQKIKTYTCINEDGEMLFSVKAKYIGSYKNGMVNYTDVVLENNKAYYREGFINAKGEIAIPAQYEKVQPFYSHVTWVMDPGTDVYYLIDLKGNKVGGKSWNKVGYFYDNRAAVYDEDGRMGFVNTKGELVIPCKYSGTVFSEGLACVLPYDSKEEIYGFIDTTGTLVIPYQYKQPGVTSFQDGEARVMIKGVTCLIDKKANVVFKPTLTKNCMGFYDGLSASYTNYSNRSGFGFYNRDNEWVIKPTYDYAGNFENGFAIVEKNKKQGVINLNGDIVIPMDYDFISGNPGSTGYFSLEKEMNGPKTYVNEKGEPFSSESVKYLYPANGHKILPYTHQNGKCGFLNLDGTVFIEAQFDAIKSFNEGKGFVIGNTYNLKKAAGISDDMFAREYKVGDKVKVLNNGSYYAATITQIGEMYYLVKYSGGKQEWVTYGSIKPN